jgi:hypothetical protein
MQTISTTGRKPFIMSTFIRSPVQAERLYDASLEVEGYHLCGIRLRFERMEGTKFIAKWKCTKLIWLDSNFQFADLLHKATNRLLQLVRVRTERLALDAHAGVLPVRSCCSSYKPLETTHTRYGQLGILFIIQHT